MAPNQAANRSPSWSSWRCGLTRTESHLWLRVTQEASASLCALQVPGCALAFSPGRRTQVLPPTLPILVQPTASLYTDQAGWMYSSVMMQVSWHGKKARAFCISMIVGALSMVPFGACSLSLTTRCVVSQLGVRTQTYNSGTKLRQGELYV